MHVVVDAVRGVGGKGLIGVGWGKVFILGDWVLYFGEADWF